MITRFDFSSNRVISFSLFLLFLRLIQQHKHGDEGDDGQEESNKLMRRLHEGVIYRMVDHRNSAECSCAREQQNIQKVLLRKQRQGFLLTAALMFLVTHNSFEYVLVGRVGHAPAPLYVGFTCLQVPLPCDYYNGTDKQSSNQATG